MKSLILLITLFFWVIDISAQSTHPFGAVSSSDLKMTEYAKNKDAEAVYLFDWGEAKIDIFSDRPLIVKKHFCIKILKPEGLKYATIKLNYYRTRFPDFKASTFNLEDGTIKETAVTKKDFYIEKKSEDSYRISFAFNNVKVGSVIECSYTMQLESIFQFYPWVFQHEIPTMNSEFIATFPLVFQYKYTLHSNGLPINVTRNDKDIWIYSNQVTEATFKYTGEDLPAFETEPYIASESDQIARINYELERINLPNYKKSVTPTYAELSHELLKDENFGTPLTNSGFLKKKVEEITKGLNGDIDKIKAIRKYITENVKWNEEEDIFTSSENLRKVLRIQNGSAADINLLLIAMLNQADIPAHPVILSTRKNGALNTYIAVLSQFNYVVAFVRTGDKDYLIDATDADRPFDQLPFQCLNGSGRLIHEKVSEWIPLKNKEKEFDQVILNMNIGADETLQGQVERIFSSYSAYNIRKNIKTIGKEGYLEYLRHNHGNWEYNNMDIQNLDSIDKSVVIKYDIKANDVAQFSSNLCIINPVLLFNRTENPFSNAERKYPVDFGCPEDEIYTFNIVLPEGYILDEVPEDLNLKLENKGTFFIYQVNKKDKLVSIMYRYKRTETNFKPSDYTLLREFFSKMIKKQSELIILKKSDPSMTTSFK